MSRRDTIIIAVLVNAALLMVLFATSTHVDQNKKRGTPLAQVEKKVVSPNPATNETLVVDEIEEVLNQYCLAAHTFNEKPVAANVEPEIEVAPQVAEVGVATPKPSQGSNLVAITVKKGDVLEKIARANATSVSAIMQANQLSSTQLKIGQVLKVPIGATQANSPSFSQENVEYYTVQDGDSPWLIASRNHVKLEELLRINGLDEAKARRLRPGDKLRLR